MLRVSAGILLYRRREGSIEVLLAHPGGPFFASRDNGAWGIPKGELDAGEEAFAAAEREFQEETGFAVHGPYHQLTPVTQKNGKTVYAWAAEGDADPSAVRSSMFTMEWPPHSGRLREYPEVDRVGWFGISEASVKMIPAQVQFLEELLRITADRK